MIFTSGVLGIAFMLASQAEPMNLTQALSIARTNSFALRKSHSDVVKAWQQVLEARGTLGPKLTATGTYQRNDSAQSFGNGLANPLDSTQLALQMNWPIDLAGATGKLVAAAKVNLNVALANEKVSDQDLVSSVRQAFFTVIQAQNQLKIARESADRATERLTNAKKELNQGTRAKIDVLRLDADLKSAEGNVLIAQTGLAQAKAALNVALGRQILTDVNPVNPPSETPKLQGEQELINRALKNRPELEALRLTKQAAHYMTEFQGAGLSPSLNLSIQHSRYVGKVSAFQRKTSTVGIIQLSIPIYDSGVTRAKVNQSKQDEVQAQIALEQAELGVSAEVHNAFVQLTNAQTRKSVAERQLDLARENYRLAVLRFDNQEGIALEVADANTQLTSAQVAVNNAEYDIQIALAELERAIGNSLSDTPK